MPETKKLLTLIVLIVGLSSYVRAQTNSDDYWLNNGFTNGGTVITNTGIFYDDGGADLYGTSQNWSVTFCSENGNPITFDFNGFRTDYRGPFPDPPDNSYLPYDYLRISTSLQNVVAYNDDTPQFSFTDPDGCITFTFISQSTSLQDSGWVAEISANPPPVNNDPCTAAGLAVGNVCSPGFYSNKGAYNTTNLGSPSCHRYFGGDVWFTAIVPESGQLKIETFAGSLDYAIMALYSGDCNNLTEIQCVDNPGSMPATILSRTPGETIYVRMFGDQAKSGTFGICATDPTAPVTGFTGPGGVGDSISNRIWLKADEGTLNAADSDASDGEAVRSWIDMSGNENDLFQTTLSGQPLLNTGGINGMPALSFDGSDDFLSAETGNVSAPLDIFTVSVFDISADQTVFSIGDANNTSTASISREADDRYYSFSGSKHYGPTLNGSTPYILYQKNPINAPYHQLSVNATGQTVGDYGSSLTTDGSVYIGSSKDMNNFLNGPVGEVIVYEKRLNQAQEIIINNYLAAKFGIDIQTVDRYAYETGHKYDVAGIGRIDAANIHSKAQSAGILAIGGAADLEDNEFLMFGHDGGDVSTWSSNETPGGDPNTVRLAREWRIDQSGGDGTGNVSLSLDDDLLPALPAGFPAYNLLVDQDGDFSAGAVDYGLISSGDELIANNVSLGDGAYIAIMAVKPYLQFTASSGEGEESLEHPSFEVSLNYAITQPFEVNYSVSGGTADPGGVDFSLNDGILLFNPGTKSRLIQPLIIEDTQVELPDEYFTVEITNPTSGVLLGDTTTFAYTIIDNDVAVQLSSSDTVVGECAAGVELYADASGREPLTFSWAPVADLSDPANDTTLADPSSTTTYTLRVTDAHGNFTESSIDIEVVSAPAAPSVTADGDLSFCMGDSVVLTAQDAYSYLWSNGETGQEITVKSTGEYFVKIMDEYGCESVSSDTFTVEAYDLPVKPVITANSDLSFCDGDSVDLTAPVSDAYLWSTGETTQTIRVKSPGSYYVQVINENSCTSPVSDPVEVVVHPLPAKPVISYSGSTEFCQGESVELTAPVSDSYLWSTGETTRSVIVNNSGSYTVGIMDANACASPESDPVVVTVNELPVKPVITVTGDTEFCEGSSAELTAPVSDTYLWSTGETTRSVTATASGSYTLRVTDANSCTSPVSDPVDVTVHPLPAKPEITVNGSNEICAGENTMLTAPAANAYLWSTGETSQNINVSTAGSYTVSIQNQFSCTSPESDPVEITVHDIPVKPVINVNGSTEFCSGSDVELTAPASSSYHWSTGETTQSITVGTSGSYTVTTTNVNSCQSPESDPVEIIVHDLPSKPVIDITGDTEFCQGSTVELTAPASASYQWSTGETTQSITVGTSGSYTVTTSDVNSCQSPASDPVEVVVHPLPAKPEIALNGSSEICAGESVRLSAPAANAYQWSTGEVTQDIMVSTTGSYTVSIVDQYSCASPESDPVEIIVNDPPEKPVITVAGDTKFCEGSTVELTAPASASYRWSTGETTQSITVGTSGSYTVTTSDVNSCQSPASDPVEISVNPSPEQPVITPSGPIEILSGDSALLTAGAAETYQWSDGSTTQSIYVKEEGTYTVTVFNASGCPGPVSDPVAVNIINQLPAPEITVNGDTIFCEGGSVELIAEPADSYEWSTGETTRSIIVDISGTYSLTVENASGISSIESVPVEITVHPAPSVEFTSGDASCHEAEDGFASVIVTNGEAPYDFKWNNGENAQSIDGLTAGVYEVEVEDANSCRVTASVNIEQPEPIVADASVSPADCPDALDGEIHVSVSGGSAPYLISWENGSNSMSRTDLSPGSYDLTVSDNKGCSVSENYDVGYSNDVCFRIPGIITPNNDGYNDTWKIEGLELYPEAEVEIFDRWGTRVFYSKGYEGQWEGTSNGKELPMESYHYVITLNNGTAPIIGNVTIVR